jgi:hypothetical protein
MPPPLGDGIPAPGIPPPEAPPLVLQAPVTMAANAINSSGLTQLGTILSERRDVIVLALWNAQTIRCLERLRGG